MFDYYKTYGQPFKVDKNGTEYFYDHTCPRCGGTGGSSSWAYTGYTCYACGGSGKRVSPKIVKKYTDEYQKKLDDNRAKRLAKKIEASKVGADERNAEFFVKQGFDSDGYTYVILGNTYEVKDKLKALGAKFDNVIGWHFSSPIKNLPTVKIHVSEVYYKDYTDTYRWNLWFGADSDEYKALKAKIADATAKTVEDVSEFIGKVGDKIQVEVVLKSCHCFDTQFGSITLHKFEDMDGNVLVWKTSTYVDVEVGLRYMLKGTIKEHNSYKGENQTVLTRCKIVGK